MVLVRLPQPDDLLDIELVQAVDIRLVGLVAMRPAHLDRLADHDINGPTVWHQADIIVQHASAMQGWNSELEDLEDEHLNLADGGVCLGAELVVKVVFSEAQDGHEIGAGPKSHLDETFTSLQNEPQVARLSLERLPGAANNDGNSSALAVITWTTPAEDVENGLFRNRSKAHS